MSSEDFGYPRNYSTKNIKTYSRRGSTISETAAPSEIITRRTVGSTSQGQDRLRTRDDSLPLDSVRKLVIPTTRAERKQMELQLYNELKVTQLMLAKIEARQQELTKRSSSRIVSSGHVAQMQSTDHQSGTPAARNSSDPGSRPGPTSTTLDTSNPDSTADHQVQDRSCNAALKKPGLDKDDEGESDDVDVGDVAPVSNVHVIDPNLSSKSETDNSSDSDTDTSSGSKSNNSSGSHTTNNSNDSKTTKSNKSHTANLSDSGNNSSNSSSSSGCSGSSPSNTFQSNSDAGTTSPGMVRGTNRPLSLLGYA